MNVNLSAKECHSIGPRDYRRIGDNFFFWKNLTFF